jgi:hypothetical protein
MSFKPCHTGAAHISVMLFAPVITTCPIIGPRVWRPLSVIRAPCGPILSALRVFSFYQVGREGVSVTSGNSNWIAKGLCFLLSTAPFCFVPANAADLGVGHPKHDDTSTRSSWSKHLCFLSSLLLCTSLLSRAYQFLEVNDNTAEAHLRLSTPPRPQVEGVKQSIALEMMYEIDYRSWTPKKWSGSDYWGRVYKRMLLSRLLDALGWKFKASELWFGSWQQSVAKLLTDHFCSIKCVHFNAPCFAAQIPSSSFAATSLLRRSTLILE